MGLWGKVRVTATRYKNYAVTKAKESAKERRDLRYTEKQAYKKEKFKQAKARGRARAKQRFKPKPIRKAPSLSTMNRRASALTQKEEHKINPVFILGKK